MCTEIAKLSDQSRRTRLLALLLLLLLSFASAAIAIEEKADLQVFEQAVRPFLAKYCYSCHGAEVRKAGYRIDHLNPNMLSDREAAPHWNEALERLNLSEMPPPDHQPQPAVAERQLVIDWMTAELAKARRVDLAGGGQLLMRRLTRAEYARTVHELLGVEVDASGLPPDPIVEGFNKVRSALVMSPLHMEQYLVVGEAALQSALSDAPTRPTTERWRLELSELHPRYDMNARTMLRREVSFRLLQGGDPAQSLQQRHPEQTLDESGKKLRRPIRFEFKGPSQDSEYQGAWARVNYSFDFNLGFSYFLIRTSGKYRLSARVRARMDERVWPLGLPTIQLRPIEGAKHYVEHRIGDVEQPEIVSFDLYLRAGERFDVKVMAAGFDEAEVNRRKLSGRPEVQLDWLEFEGPLFDFEGWPLPRQQELLGDFDLHGEVLEDELTIEKPMRHFMERAFRRPVAPSEVQIRIALYRQARENGDTRLAALRVAWLSVLASPHFVYLIEPHAIEGPRYLTPYELACRLSYFLWNAPPDKILLDQAREGKLSTPEELRTQTLRLLSDVRSHAFVSSFTEQWLSLDLLETIAPATDIYPIWDEELRRAMRSETLATVAEMLYGNHPLEYFLKSPFVMVNQRLAAHYGIHNILGTNIRPVAVQPNIARGGLLTQGSILTLTSNGNRTSPVRRGVFLLEHILGAPPPPPPPGAGEIANAVPGEDKVTVRERLRLHREVESCAACHNKIDPLGFCLENFDGIGRWRNLEISGDPLVPASKGGAVDPSGVLPGGIAVDGLAGLQQWLVTEKDRFVRCLAEKLMIMALGRLPNYTDRELLENIVKTTRTGENSMRAVIVGIVQSDPFRKR